MKEVTNKYIGTIYTKLSSNKPENETFFAGKGSHILFNYELYTATGCSCYKNRVIEQMCAVTKKIQSGRHAFSGFSLANVLTGYGWLSNLLSQESFLEQDKNILLNLNDHLTNTAISFLEIGATDYMNGAFGILHYLLSAEQTDAIKEQVNQIIEKILVTQGDVYSIFRNGIVYPEKMNELNLGFGFGLSGQLMILLKAYKMGYDNDNPSLGQTIKIGLNFILSHKIDVDYSEDIFSFFPETVNKESNTLRPTNRLTWFCSDLNHAILLYEAAEVFQIAKYKTIAAFIALQTIQRKTEQETKVFNSSLFLGSSGVAAMFNKLYSYDKLAPYKEAYEFWIQKTIFSVGQEIKSNHYNNNESSFLNGLTGVSLMLLSYTYDRPLHWEQLLLM